ncbi:DUF6261 family protein [Kordia sp.]|uniref:DUF6261 family protein n=1 Tax=Kordia sp. TaxID=1965332 RepID=UPI003D2B85BF
MNTPMLDRYRNSEFLQYMKDVLGLVDAHDVPALTLTTQHNNLTEKIDLMDGLFQQQLSSGITQELIDIDTERDKAFSGIKGLLEAYLLHYDDAMVQAAKNLLYNLNNYGTGIPRMNYQAETAVIDSMLADWETNTSLSNAVATLGLANWIGVLKTKNENFTNRYLARVTESAAGTAASFTEVRIEGATAYRDLVAHISAHATLNSSEIHKNLEKEISVLAKQYNLTVNMRAGNTDDTIEDEDTTTDDSATPSDLPTEL